MIIRIAAIEMRMGCQYAQTVKNMAIPKMKYKGRLNRKPIIL